MTPGRLRCESQVGDPFIGVAIGIHLQMSHPTILNAATEERLYQCAAGSRMTLAATGRPRARFESGSRLELASSKD
jgi:hypothetical protein